MVSNYVKKFRNQRGQAVLIVLLSLSVVLIVVLFIMSRSVTDISLSTKEEDSLRAFSAAEAGVERALVIGNSSGTIDSANFNANVTAFAEGATEVIFPLSLKSGENATFWFSRAGEAQSYTGSQIKYCWGDIGTISTASDAPAIEVTIFYTTTPNDLTTLRIARATLDPNTSRRSSSNFGVGQDSTCTIGSDSFEYQATLILSNLGLPGSLADGVLQYSTAKILYNTTTAHKIAIDVNGTGSTLPSQGNKVVSDGSFGNANRKVEVYQLHPEVPPIFANAIFSSSGIIK